MILVDDRLSQNRTKYALKIINKSVLHNNQISVIHGESKILRSLVGKANIVQFVNIFETKKFIIIQMEHLGGCQMKKEINLRLKEAEEKYRGDADIRSGSTSHLDNLP